MKMLSSGQRKISLQLFIVVLVLWLTLIVSSLAVVYTTYKTRVEFNYLQSLKREHNELQLVLSQYLLEESAWASFSRIEKIALEHLNMQLPKAEQTMMMVQSHEG